MYLEQGQKTNRVDTNSNDYHIQSRYARESERSEAARRVCSDPARQSRVFRRSQQETRAELKFQTRQFNVHCSFSALSQKLLCLLDR